MPRFVRLLAGVAIALVVGCGGGGGASPASTASGGPLPQVTFAGVTPNAGNWALQLGVSEGLFQKYGVDAKMIYAQSSPAALAALIGGSVQFTSTVYDAGIIANQQSKDVVYVAGGYSILPYELIVSPEIKDISQLKGKTCGAQNPANVGDGLYDQLMIKGASNGALSYPADYKFVTVNLNAASATAAFKSGAIQCIGELPPTSSQLNSLGYPTLVHAETLSTFKDLPFFGINSLKSWDAANKDTVKKWLMGYMAAIAFLYDPANKQRAIDVLAKNANLTPEVAAQSYDWVAKKGYPRDGTIPPDAIRNTLKVQQSVGAMTNVTSDPTPQIVDLSYAKAAYAALPANLKKSP